MDEHRAELALKELEGIPTSALEHGAVKRLIGWARETGKEGVVSLQDLTYLRTILADLDGAE